MNSRLAIGFLTVWFAIAGIAATPAQDLAITEILAVNESGLRDADGDASDWIEVGNLGATAISLAGSFLTDDAANLTQWCFPAVELAPGELLVVFASGKDRAVAGQELHTNFRLSGGGEFLALVAPDGATILHEYSPAYPEQYEDVSFGLAEQGASRSLVDALAAARVLVPSNDALGLDWTLPEFDDTPWIAGANSVGFDTDGGLAPPPGEEVNLARDGTASQSSQLSGFAASLAIDGDYGNFTHTLNSDNNATWEVDLGGTFPIASIVLHNRGGGCCQSRLRDVTVRILEDDGTVAFESELLNAENVLAGGTTGGPATIPIDFIDRLGAAVSGRVVRVTRTPDPDLSGSGGAGNPDEATVLSLGEVEVFEGVNGFAGLVTTDLEAEMLDVNSSAFIRLPFDVANPGQFESLRLRMKYDDGFVAYLNGVEVARANAPGPFGQPPAWNADATAERDDSAAILTQEIDISESLDALEAGENVLAIHGLNLSDGDGDFLIHAELVGLESSSLQERYFETPTPGGVNDTSGIAGFVADTMFSVDRGFYTDPFTVEITTATEDALIRYTVDGSSPSRTRGTLYRVPVPIDGTTILRAIAYKEGFRPTNIDTQTYVFTDDVIASPVMRTSITQHPTYGPQMGAALTDLPSISLVTSGTINNNTEIRTSIEWLDPEGGPDFQEDAGIKYFGGLVTNFAKKNFRIFFRGTYGARKLRFPIFLGHDRTIPAVDSFDQIELRGGSHDMNQRGFYMSNRFADDTMLDMGNLNPHGRFVHVYIDGTYWGQYHLRERWHDGMHASYLGGQSSDYESINGNRNVGGNFGAGFPYDGDGSTWDHAKSLRRDYEAVREWVDLQNYVDFMLMWNYGNSEAEYRCVGPTTAGSGFKFYLNDGDGFTRNTGSRIGNAGPGEFFSGLRSEGHPDFITFLGDRMHEHFFNDGAMTPPKMTARLLERCDQVERAFFAEAARWDYRTPASWQSARDAYVNGVLPSRTSTVVSYFRSAGLYPSVAAPVFSRAAGAVPTDAELTMEADAGTVYYTADGSDPRLPGGALSPTALEYSDFGNGGTQVVLLASEAPVRVRVPTDGALGLDWTLPGYNDVAWRSGSTGVGYERSSGYEDLIGLDVESEMYDASASVYLRLAFNVDDRDAFEALLLRMKYDDGFVAYLNGERVTAAGAPATPAWNSSATGSHADSLAVAFENFDISDAIEFLRNGRNVLAIHGLNSSSGSSDLLILPELVAREASDDPDDPDGTIVLDRTLRMRARARIGTSWSALNEAVYVVDSSALRITELMYHPPEAPEDSPFSNRDEFEFVEFQNTSDRPLNLMGIRFAAGVEFEFPELPPEEDLAPGEFVLIVKNFEAFSSRYDTEGLYIAGEYRGNLSNGGELVLLQDSLGRPLADFVYSDTWHPLTDGFGPSLEVADPEASPELLRDRGGWQPSELDGGTPGAGRVVGPPRNQLPGDTNQDGAVDISDAVALLRYLFLGTPSVLPCGDGTLASEDNVALLDANGDLNVDVADATSTLIYLFQRGEPHALGTRCIHLPTCPPACAR